MLVIYTHSSYFYLQTFDYIRLIPTFITAGPQLCRKSSPIPQYICTLLFFDWFGILSCGEPFNSRVTAIETSLTMQSPMSLMTPIGTGPIKTLAFSYTIAWPSTATKPLLCTPIHTDNSILQATKALIADIANRMMSQVKEPLIPVRLHTNHHSPSLVLFDQLASFARVLTGTRRLLLCQVWVFDRRYLPRTSRQRLAKVWRPCI